MSRVSVLMPVQQAKDMQHVDANPYQKVPDGRQHEKFLEDQIVNCQHEGQPHSQLIQ